MTPNAVFRLIVALFVFAVALGLITVAVFSPGPPPARAQASLRGFDAGPCLVATYGAQGLVNLRPASIACLNDHRDERVIADLHAPSDVPTYVMLPTAYQCDWRYSVNRCPAPRRDEKCMLMSKGKPRVVCFWWRTENLGKPDQFTNRTTHMVYE